jgi:hypothetical protein
MSKVASASGPTPNTSASDYSGRIFNDTSLGSTASPLMSAPIDIPQAAGSHRCRKREVGAIPWAPESTGPSQNAAQTDIDQQPASLPISFDSALGQHGPGAQRLLANTKDFRILERR